MADNTNIELPGIYESSHTKQMVSIYGMMSEDETPQDLLTSLLLVKNSYFTARKKTGQVVGDNGRNRSNYDEVKGKLMDYSPDETVDSEVEKRSIQLLVSAINSFLSDKQELPTGSSRKSVYSMVRVLMLQMIKKGSTILISEVNIPPYVKDMVDSALDYLEQGIDTVFNDWLTDLQELGNEHLIDFVNSIGPEFFGRGTSTKSQGTYKKYLQPYLSTIKNSAETYKRFLLRREQYGAYVDKIQLKKLYPIFDLTADQYRHTQNTLFQEFQLRFSKDVNSQYILKMIYGIQD